MTILDSNVWIAFFNEMDNQHKKAEKVIKKLNNNQIVVPEYIVTEVASILRFKAGKEVSNDFIKSISDNDDIIILLSDEFFFNNVVDNFINLDGCKLSFIDIAILYLSKNYKVITFDKNLEKAIKIF
ncbi:type II toxin-antitoxin system VapC family toxin [bacterium]|nr:type II toxin-antitoxin system VapC family toxin [bacterium]